MNNHPLKFSSVIVALCCLLTFVASAQTGETPGYNSGPASSQRDADAKVLTAQRLKHEVDLFTGSFTFALPIDLAPARNGSEPKLVLAYSSSGDNGWCGVGWALDIGYIERYTKDGVPIRWDTATPASAIREYDDTKGFLFQLNGKTGKLASIGGNSYRAEIEEDFLTFTLDLTNNRWDVFDRRGNLFRFGKSTASRLGNPDAGWSPTLPKGTFRWALDEIITATGDHTTVTYAADAGNRMIYPSQIKYNGHLSHNGLTGVLSPTHTVSFVIENRTDHKLSYRSGFRVNLAKRLSSITCQVQPPGASSPQTVRSYRLEYDLSPSTKRSLLKRIRTIGTDGLSALPVKSFTYTEKPFQFEPVITPWTGMVIPSASEANWKTVSGFESPGVLVADLVDIDGDGLPDRVRRKRSTGVQGFQYDYFVVQRNLGLQGASGAFGPEISWGPTPSQSQNTHREWTALNSGYTRFLDIDGDGRPDRVMDPKGANLNMPNNLYNHFPIERNTGTGFAAATWPGVSSQDSSTTDFRVIEHSPYYVKLIDINGDGLPDRVMCETQAAKPYDYLMVQLNTGSGFGPVRRHGPYASQGESNDILWAGIESPYLKFIDINGDGLPDRVMLPKSSISSGPVQSASLDRFIVEFNTGYSFEAAPWFGVNPQYNVSGGTTAFYCAIESFPMVGLLDINGDHLPDRVMLKHAEHSKWLVQINNGSGFEPIQEFSNIANLSGGNNPAWYGINGCDQSGFTYGDALTPLIDINGDGLPDRVMADYTSLLGGTTFPGFKVSLNAGPVPDLMRTANNGVGGSATVQYKPSTAWDNRKDLANANSERLLPFPVQTVHSVSVSDGLYPERTTRYEYQGGGYDPARREFAGFATVTITDPPSITGQPGRKQVYWFHQGGGRDETARGEYQDAGNFAKRGKPFRIESIGNDGLLYQVTINQVQQFDLGQGRRFPYVHQSCQLDYPGGGATYKARASRFEYNSNTGNLIKQTDFGEIRDFNFSAHTFIDSVPADTVYQHYSWATISGNANIKSQPDTIKLTSDSTGSAILQETKFTYFPSHGSQQQQQRRISSGYYATESCAYNSFGNLNSITDEAGVNVTIDQFDSSHIHPVLTRARIAPGAISADDHLTTTDYDLRSGLPRSIIDPKGLRTENNYDPFFRITETRVASAIGLTVADLWMSKFQYHLGGVANGVSLNSVKITRRDKDGASQTDGHDTWLYADGLGRIIQTRMEAETSPKFRVSNIVYDERGEPFLTTWTKFEDYGNYLKPAGAWPAAFTGFDASGRLSEKRARVDAQFTTAGIYSSHAASTGDSTSPLGAQRLQYKDASNNPWAIIFTDEESKQRRFYLDGFGRTNLIVEVDGTSLYNTQFQYDPAGNLLRITNATGDTVEFGYDDAGRLVAMADPHLGLWKYKRDLAGRIREQIDGNGQKIVFQYTAPLKRLSEKKVYSASGQLLSTATYTYDKSDAGDSAHTAYKGLLYKIVDSEGWEKHGYDTRGRPQKTSRFLNLNGQTYTTTQAYDQADRLVSTAYPMNGPAVGYRYNNAGFLHQVFKGSYVYYSANAFDELGNLAQFGTHHNGLLTTHSYYTVSKRLHSISSTPLSRAYQYDRAGNVTSISGNPITYDNLHRLKTYGGISGSYNYDQTGNITANPEGGATTYSYGAARKQAVKLAFGKKYLYDLCGNMIVRGNQVLEYDAENRLIRAAEAGVAPAPIEFGYSAQGDRLWKKTPATTQIWIGKFYEEKQGKKLFHIWAEDRRICTFEPGSPLALAGGRPWLKPWKNHEWTVAENLGTWYAFCMVLALAALARHWPRPNRSSRGWSPPLWQRACAGLIILAMIVGTAPVIPSLQAQTSATVSYYYHQDHLGSSSALTTNTGALIESNTWLPFGRAQTASPQAPFQLSNRFTGQVLDPETGLYYFGARYYDPLLGRFIQPDTIIPDYSNPQSFNRYSYVLNNPLKHVDQDGHLPVLVATAIGGALIGGVIGGVKAYMAGGSAGQIAAGIGKGAAIGGFAGLTCGVAAGALGASASTLAGYTAISSAGGLAAQTAEFALGERASFSATDLAFAAAAGPAAKAVSGVAGQVSNLARAVQQGGKTVGIAEKNVVSLDANAIRFSQSNVRSSLGDITPSMRANGWRGSPIDVVRMADGSLVTVDNTRLAAASLSRTPVQAVIRRFDEVFPAARAGGNLRGATWGEAVLNRIDAQKPGWQRLYPSGSPFTGVHPSTPGFSP
jgi:RHS repeat-associated protein